MPDITVPESTTAATPSATATTVSQTADGGQESAILAAYSDALADFNQVAATAPVNPESPILADHKAGSALASVTKSLAALAQAGQVDTGALITLHAAINQYNGSQAVVVACERDTVAVVNAATRQVVPGHQASDSTELVNDLVTLQDGVWKVTDVSEVSPGCS